MSTTPTPTRLQDCALYEHAARSFRARLWPASSPRYATAYRLQRMKDLRETIQKNLRSDCANPSRFA